MLIDSNILIYALNNSSPGHLAAQRFLQTQRAGLIFAQQNLFETLRILTHQKFPHPFSVSQALRAIQTITQDATILCPTYETSEIAWELIRKYQIGGPEIFDAYLVATALSHQVITIATDNVKHLGKYTEIAVINPFRTS